MKVLIYFLSFYKGLFFLDLTTISNDLNLNVSNFDINNAQKINLNKIGRKNNVFSN
jgi:hypothetical protein